jgi:hypothetical protein
MLSLTRTHVRFIQRMGMTPYVDRTRFLMIWQKWAVKWLQIGRSKRGKDGIRHVSIATATKSTQKELV